jgi:hypothetical protein
MCGRKDESEGKRQNKRSVDLDINPRPPGREAGILNSRLRLWIIFVFAAMNITDGTRSTCRSRQSPSTLLVLVSEHVQNDCCLTDRLQLRKHKKRNTQQTYLTVFCSLYCHYRIYQQQRQRSIRFFFLKQILY